MPVELKTFLLQHGVPFREGGTHRHVRPGWIGVDCPRCGPGSGRFHAGVREDLRQAACWRCGGFRPLELVALAAGREWWEVRDALESVQRPPAGRACPPNRSGLVTDPKGLRALTRPARRFLVDRGFDPDAIASLWGVRSTGPAGRLAWRLWIPIHLNGEVVSWTTRAVGTSDRRYVSAAPHEEAVDHKSLLYGEDLAGHAVVVVEGPTDAWRIGPGAVATLGLQVTPAQVERIARHPVRAICFDNERAALRRADRLASLLAQSPGDTYVVELETGDDPADADDEEVDEIRRKFLDQGLTGRGGML